MSNWDSSGVGRAIPKAGTFEEEMWIGRVKLVVPKKDKAKRSCLRCDRIFTSVGKHNRTCGGCAHYLSTYCDAITEYNFIS